MGFELRDHTADIAVSATGESLEDVFSAVADGLTAAHLEDAPDPTVQFSIAVRAESRESLLFDFLDELIFQRDVRNVLPADHDVDIQRDGLQWTLECTAGGIPLEDIAAREIKAVTYSEMSLEETNGGWEAYVVFDV
ncbi:MAG: archease [Natronomonas sp.]